jgi:hypothetical protein
MKSRNKKYEDKFKTYLFSFPWEIHREICTDLNVVESTEKTRSSRETIRNNTDLYKQN